MAMTSHEHDRLRKRDEVMTPPILLRSMLALVVASLVLVTYARLTDRPLVATPPEVPAVAERTIVIDGEMSGAATVTDAGGAVIARLAPEQGGFIAGVKRALDRERIRHGVALDTPVRLVRFADGRLGLRDDATGWRAELIGFGADNAAAFARLLD